MLVVECKGTPYEIGCQHGSAAKVQVDRCIVFYAALFKKNCKIDWPQVREHAAKFERHARQEWPAYHEEMRGIADGAGKELLDIVALNVRTEINFGLFSDGCTSLAWHTANHAFLGQNWDWMSPQKLNLIITKITQPNLPTIQQITEAGIIGKIGFNSFGVGTCLNAIKVQGVNPEGLPVHFGLRMALESTTAMEAVEKLEKYGMASSAHILIADPFTAIGLEFSAKTFARCVPDVQHRIVHTNHLLEEHPGVVDTVWLKDSPARAQTMLQNLERVGEEGEPRWGDVSRLFNDETGAPAAINRVETPESGSGTLFNIVMDLRNRKAVVGLGRPTEVEETVVLEL
ncbi:peptidase C45 acyl-coenzyme A:6-aminopenicillanic acid acyl-transferas-like protein [Lojkania enalia]|uniref:Peptidase C45 acyl-coenzyme A:6-aminopenicillanic acid acyl-transferas-like protein n=1 Tax=Lojkania enalia TaxID=147567 RepID=A0A9P4NBC4_9PLEO|nr:peptidase C45 acyl-coenzyme A:6-aminopenicillanic acid acyl-transferas-like protein [Didymosphaeria enalia]